MDLETYKRTSCMPFMNYMSAVVTKLVCKLQLILFMQHEDLCNNCEITQKQIYLSQNAKCYSKMFYLHNTKYLHSVDISRLTLHNCGDIT